MDKTEALELIGEHRDSIDELDTRIIELLNERAGHSLAIRALKPAADMQLFDPAREDQIFARLEAKTQGPMRGCDVHDIYATVLKVMKEIPA